MVPTFQCIFPIFQNVFQFFICANTFSPQGPVRGPTKVLVEALLKHETKIWNWKMEIETWNGNLILEPETETWNRNLKLKFDIETWNLNLVLEPENETETRSRTLKSKF